MTLLLIFDLDGTLVDSRRDICAAVNRMRADYGLPPLPLESVTKYIGDGIRKLVERALAHHPADLDEATERCARHYRDHLHDETDWYPGVRDGLRSLAEAGHRLAVISNKPSALCRELLQHLGALDAFAVVLGGDDTPNRKPHPEPVLGVMKRLDMTPENTWMIGDHVTDLEAARRAGVRSAFLTCGIGERGSEQPTATFDSFAALVEFFAQDDDESLAAKK